MLRSGAPFTPLRKWRFAVQEQTQIRLNDLVRLRKPHPCGSNEWLVVRVGADIGLKCRGCGRRILLDRSKFRKQLKAVIGRLEAEEALTDRPS